MFAVPDGVAWRRRMDVLRLLFRFPGSAALVQTVQVLEGLVRQLTRGMPSLVPVPRKMSSDCCRCFSCSDGEVDTAPPRDAPALHDVEEEKERAELRRGR
jgi:hypothetical protein